jgi:hypothetical protein
MHERAARDAVRDEQCLSTFHDAILKVVEQNRGTVGPTQQGPAIARALG